MITNHGDQPGWSATFSDDHKYRYHLSREIPFPEPVRRRILWIMLNPSTADALSNDPTVKRCINYSGEWGFDRVEVVNLFALVSTNPTALRQAVDPVGPLNDTFIMKCAKFADRIMVAWGDHGDHEDRGDQVLSKLQMDGRSVWTFGFTQKQQPLHPLYRKASDKPERLF